MKILLLAALFVLAGCEDQHRCYYWTIERENVEPDEIQRRHNIMAKYGWVDQEDNDLQKSGKYVYYARYYKLAEADAMLLKIKAELEEVRK